MIGTHTEHNLSTDLSTASASYRTYLLAKLPISTFKPVHRADFNDSGAAEDFPLAVVGGSG